MIHLEARITKKGPEPRFLPFVLAPLQYPMDSFFCNVKMNFLLGSEKKLNIVKIELQNSIIFHTELGY